MSTVQAGSASIFLRAKIAADPGPIASLLLVMLKTPVYRTLYLAFACQDIARVDY